MEIRQHIYNCEYCDNKAIHFVIKSKILKGLEWYFLCENHKNN